MKACFDALFSKVDRLDVLIDNARYALTGAAEATWLPRLKKVAPWGFFAAGVRRSFGLGSNS